MKKTARIIFSVLCAALLLTSTVFAEKLLVPVGQVVGLELGNKSVIVAAFDDVLGQETKKAGMQVGDEILQIDGQTISKPEQVHKALLSSDGEAEVQVRRNNREKTLHIRPQITRDGPRLGIYLSRGMTGIGTVTWYDPETGVFGTLGHGVKGGNGKLLEMNQGAAYQASVMSVKKGRSGHPGQLCGAVQSETALGVLSKNTEQGVFGRATEAWIGEVMPVAEVGDIQTGAATMWSTVSGERVQEYSVEILKIYPKDRADGRNLLLQVTDPELLEITGGIVPGMSGSPIIQNGKLIGAVTHVLVDDPTRGYGIFIENMLESAS